MKTEAMIKTLPLFFYPKQRFPEANIRIRTSIINKKNVFLLTYSSAVKRDNFMIIPYQIPNKLICFFQKMRDCYNFYFYLCKK